MTSHRKRVDSFGLKHALDSFSLGSSLLQGRLQDIWVHVAANLSEKRFKLCWLHLTEVLGVHDHLLVLVVEHLRGHAADYGWIFLEKVLIIVEVVLIIMGSVVIIMVLILILVSLIIIALASATTLIPLTATLVTSSSTSTLSFVLIRSIRVVLLLLRLL